MQGLDRRSRARGPGGTAMTAAGRGAPRRPGRWPARRSPWLALVLLASAQLMLVLDVTVVNVALPDIGTALNLGRGEVPWVMTAYTLVFGGLMLLGGRIADLFGARRLTLAGLALFTASSLLCALSQDAAMLLAGRSLQGLGAALMSPAALATVMTLFTGPRRGKALGVWSGLAGVGGAENRMRVLDGAGQDGVDEFGAGLEVAVERDAAHARRRRDVGDAHLGVAGQAVRGRVQDRCDVAAGIGPLGPAGRTGGIAGRHL